jgi:hypothetical protein
MSHPQPGANPNEATTNQQEKGTLSHACVHAGPLGLRRFQRITWEHDEDSRTAGGREALRALVESRVEDQEHADNDQDPRYPAGDTTANHRSELRRIP